MRRSVARGGADTAAILDPQVADYGPGFPWNGFDGGGGSLLLGDGWAPPENDAGGSFSWVVGTRALLHFGPDGTAGPSEIRAVCRSLGFAGAPRQDMIVRINETVVGSATIPDRWQEIVVPLPGGVIAPGVNTVHLEFAWAKSPADAGINEDRRHLAAAFRWVAVRWGDTDGRGGGDGGGAPRLIDLAADRLVLEPGQAVKVPVPPAAQLNAELKAMSVAGADVELKIDFVDGENKQRALWSGEVKEGWSRKVTVSNEEPSLGTLMVCNLATSSAGVSDPGTVSLEWHPALFTVERRGSPAHISAGPNIFLYVVDTLRADALALFGGQRRTSPELEDFARDAVVYRDAIAASTWTLPSVTSILTGSYPFRHGIMRGDRGFSPENPCPSLASVLSRHGYDTVGISQSYIVGPKFGLSTGFNRFFLENHLNGWNLRTASIRRVFTEWLKHEHDWQRPIFAYIHTVGPHAPYHPISPFRGFADASPGRLPERAYLPSRFVSEDHGRNPSEVAHLRALYDGEVAYEDHEFGRFIDELRFLGLYDDSLIVFVSDHGEEFADHGGFDHGRTVYEEVARVPLVVKFPGSSGVRGVTIQRRVSTVDIFATVLDVAGVKPAAPEPDGRPLPKSESEERRIVAGERGLLTELDVTQNETYRAVAYRGFWFGTTKCIQSLTGFNRYGEPEPYLQVFDLSKDPIESTALPGDDSRFEECQATSQMWSRLITSVAPPSSQDDVVSDEARDMLRALGYVK